MNVQKEDKGKEGTVRGSLATLSTAYGDSDDDSSSGELESETENDHRPSPIIKREPETLVENPLYEPAPGKVPIVVKEEPGVNCKQSDFDSESMGIKVKVEPSSEGGTDCDKDATSRRATDFGTLCKENEDITIDLELSVDDFFPSTESYGEARPIKVEVESGTSDSETDSEEEHTSDEEEEGLADQNDQDKTGKSLKKKPDGPKVKGELTLYDLPPIEDLHISVPHDECKPIGEIKSVVEPLVIVEAYLDTPALDLDSVLFLEEGDRALGHVFDVIGPVKQPMYCVRFNSKEHIERNKVEVGMPVYCAPKTPYTSFVFLAQLKRMKGSDASWMNDIEPPVEEVEFSDDEMEKIAKKKKRNRNRLLKARATEEDATHQENNDSGETQVRGKKRHHNFTQNPTNTYYNAPHGSVPNFNSNEAPVFLPPNVPGFNMHRPQSSGFHGYSSAEGWLPNMRPDRGFPRHRGARTRGFQSFPPPPPNTGQPYSNGQTFHRIPYPQMMHVEQWGPGPWCPPPQWSNQNCPNFNFAPNSQNPYQMFRMQAYQSNQTQPRPPPPPPPPPPPGL